MQAMEPMWQPQDTRLASILGVTPSRYAITVYLLTCPNGATSSELARALGLTRQAVTFQLQQLREAGAITSDADPYFAPQGQRPVYRIDKAFFFDALHGFGQCIGISIVETADLQPDNVRRQIAQRLRNILTLIDQADGKI